MTPATDHEFGAAMEALVDRWCEQRRLRPLARLLPAYLDFDGLTDGWADLRSALLSVRAIGVEELGESDWTTVDELIRATDRALGRA